MLAGILAMPIAAKMPSSTTGSCGPTAVVLRTRGGQKKAPFLADGKSDLPPVFLLGARKKALPRTTFVMRARTGYEDMMVSRKPEKGVMNSELS